MFSLIGWDLAQCTTPSLIGSAKDKNMALAKQVDPKIVVTLTDMKEHTTILYSLLMPFTQNTAIRCKYEDAQIFSWLNIQTC